MGIVINDLDSNVSSKITSVMTEELYYRLRTLPLSSEVDKIKSVITDSFKQQLDGIVTDYYRAFAERDIDCNISTEDYVNLYLGRM